MAGRWIWRLRAGLSGAALALLAGAAVAAPPGADGALHVASPDWRDQVIYFVMTDRFDDGDPRNNDQGANEYNPDDGARYSGGDLRGVTRRLDYIRGLGATAVWITPPVANQWWNPVAQYGGYHGYWARDFKRVDAHLGDLRDYRELSRALHGAGMYLIQDVVVNHTADYFGYRGGWDATDPAAHFVRHALPAGIDEPRRRPFAFNDARDARQRRAAIYHWTPDISDYNDPVQLLDYQLAGLDDLNTENPVVRAALRDAYGYWIRAVGVDAFRVDTAFYVPPDYFADFLHADDRRHPGMATVAAATGRADFHVFGEGFAVDKPYEDTQARRIDAYMRDRAGRALLPGMLNFPLYGTLGDVFARGRPTAELGYRIDSMMRVHAQPWLMPSFVDNHDVDRFLAGGSEAGLKQALLAMLTLPGIPTIYYGTEQGFTEQRGSMFARGYAADGRDHFDPQAPLYRYLQRAIALRRSHRVLSRGTPTMLASNAAAPGAVAWRMDDAASGAPLLVALNSSDRPSLLADLDPGVGAGQRLQAVFAIDGDAPQPVTDRAGRVSLLLPPRAGYVWALSPTAAAPAAPSPIAAMVIDPLPAAPVRGDLVLHGSVPLGTSARLVIDGDVAAARAVTPGRDGRWRATLDTADMIDPAVAHSVVLWDAVSARVSTARRFHVDREWTLRAEADDPAGDDHGPQGRYAYPLGTDWEAAHPADLLGTRVWTSGGALRVQLRLRRLGAAWNPPQGFDHVAFTVYLQLPGRADGARVMPLQFATLPDAMRWHYRLRANGWTNAWTRSDGADAQHEGAIVAPAPQIAVDRERATVTFTWPARAMGAPSQWTGARVYVTTWDYDGGYRELSAQPGAGAFGGGDAQRDPRVMDASAVLRLR